MPRVPLIGRLFWHEYLALVGSFLLIGLEGLVRVITLALPQPIIRFLYNRSRSLFILLSTPQGKLSRSTKHRVVSSIREASDFVDLCALFGYYAEEHVVQTGDGYLLGLHRLGWKKGEEGTRVNCGEDSIRKRVVYLHHGLLMNSEVWVCLTEKERCLPFMLVEKGYDVWLGNNRGNKYSKKSINHPPMSFAFWNFSMDEFAFHDIPDSISYILSTTSQSSLSYVGFSQGTAQAFASLSIHPRLNDKVDVFIALAPAMSPAGLHNNIVDALIKASPEVMFLAFGRRIILSSATMWQAVLYPPIFVRIIDMSLGFLFNWSGRNISTHQKLAAYPHLYSFTSTKSVVHWFQIIRNKSFQMYDDDVSAPLTIGGGAKHYKVAKYPTRNIKTPIVLVYGGSDSLVDIQVMLKELPKHTVAQEIPHFEHLDFLWGDDVNKLVFPYVFDALDSYSDPTHPKEKPSFKTMRYGSLTRSDTQQPPSYSEDERLAPNKGRSERRSPGNGAGGERHKSEDTTKGQSEGSTTGQQQPVDTLSLLPETPPQRSPATRSTPATHATTPQSITPRPTSSTAQPSSPTTTPSPAPTSRVVASTLLRRPKSGSFSSLESASSPATLATRPGIGSEGISLGMARPVGGVVSRGVGSELAPPGRGGTGAKRTV